MVVSEPIERAPAAAAEVAAMVVDNYRDAAADLRTRVLPDKAWAGDWAEAIVEVEGSNGLLGERRLASGRREAVDRSLVAADVHQGEQLLHWGKRVPQQGGHRQAEVSPLEDGPQGNPQEGVVAVVADQRKVAVDNVAVGWAPQEAEARHH
jgi:hypothetical protein